MFDEIVKEIIDTIRQVKNGIDILVCYKCEHFDSMYQYCDNFDCWGYRNFNERKVAEQTEPSIGTTTADWVRDSTDCGWK